MGSRKSLCLLLSILWLVPASLAGANLAFVFHGSASTVSIYDADTMTLLGTPTVGPGATRAFGVPDPSNPTQFLKLYVITTDSIVVLNPQPPFSIRATLTLPGSVPPGPNSAVLTGDASKLLVAAGNQVHVVRTTDSTDGVALSIPLDSTPSGIAVLPNSKRAYIISSNSAIVRIIELLPAIQLLSLAVSIPGGPAPTALGIAPNGSRIYVATPGAIYDIDRVSNTPATPISNPFFSAGSLVFDPDPPVAAAVLTSGVNAPIMSLSSRSVGLNPFSTPGSLAINKVVLPGANRAFLLAGVPGRLFQGFLGAGGLTSEVTSPATGLPLGTNAVDLEASPGGRFVFAAFAAESRLVRVDPSGALLPAQVGTSLTPTGLSLAFAPATQAALFEIYGGNNQTVPANTTFPATLAVRARAANPHGAFGQTVTFSSATSGVSFTDPTAQTNLWGVAETQVMLPVATVVQVQASIVSGGFTSTVTFTLNGGISPTEGLTKVSGDRQMTSSGAAFPRSFVVRATSGGVPVPFLSLTVSSSPSVSCTTPVTTGVDGEASIFCSALVVASTTSAEISVTDAVGRTLPEPFTVTIVAAASDLPTELLVDTDGTLQGVVRETFPDAIRVRAVKADGTGVEGVGVAFTSEQDVTFNPRTAVTGASGFATTSVTFGCFSGIGTIRATALAPGTPSRAVNFIAARGAPAQMLKRQGDNQSGNPGRRLDGPGQALVVQLADLCGNGIPAQTVQWSVNPPGAATLENVFGTTDQDGRSSVLVRLGNRAGPFSVVATSGALTATFTLSVNVIPTRLVLVSGNNQNVVVGQTAGQPLTVEIQDDNGVPAAGVDVAFRVTGGSATLSAARVTTDALGRASTRVQAGGTLGTITVVAEAINRTVTFTITVVGRVPVATTLGFVNGASFRLGWVPGSLGTIFGVGLMEGIAGIVQADRAPFPTTLRGVRVVVEGIDAPIISLVNIQGQEQINIQVPVNIPAPGSVTVVIHNNGSSTTVVGVRTFAVQPGIFEFDFAGARFAAALHADFSVVTPSNPARRGEIILLFLTGLGATNPPVGTNVAGPVPPAQTSRRPVVGINDEGAEVQGSFYAPGLYTAYQINFFIPPNARSGVAKISVGVDGEFSQDARIPIQ